MTTPPNTPLVAPASAWTWTDVGSATAARYGRHGARLQTALDTLYGQHPEFPIARAQLLHIMAQAARERGSELRALDDARSARTDWFTRPEMIGYCAYVDRFGGTLNGVAGRIGYLQEMGVTYLHLLPFLRARAGDNDGGFAVTSFDEVEPALGTVADLEALTARLRSAGISLAADLVLNHVADDHAWALAARAGDVAAREFFHVLPDLESVHQAERTLEEVFPGTAPGNFTHVAAMNGWVWTTFYPYQWDLNYGNPAVFVQVAAAMLRLANRGVEVFRLDSAPFLWKRPGTNCRNLPEVHTVLEALRAIVDICAPAVLLKAEAIVPIADLGPYLGAAPPGSRAPVPQCHLAYHSSLMAGAWVAMARQDCTLLREVVAQTPRLASATAWLTYVRCHDDIVWNVLRPTDQRRQADIAHTVAAAVAFLQGRIAGSYARGQGSFSNLPGVLPHGTNGMAGDLVGLSSATTAAEKDAATRRLLLLYGLALVFGGIPLIYMGDELGQCNDNPEAVPHAGGGDSRWIQRPRLDERRYEARNDPVTDAGAVYGALRTWITLRRSLPALAAGTPVTVLATPHAAVLKIMRGDGFLALFNFGAAALTVDIPEGTPWRDAMTRRACGGAVALLPWQMCWLQR